MHNFKELIMWQKTRALNKQLYELTRSFPKEEIFGLTSQMRRAAISISSNIAEGCGRRTEKELVNFLGIASGSSTELESQCILAADLGFLSEVKSQEIQDKITEIQKMLTKLIDKFKATY